MATLSLVESVDAFIEAIEKSGLLSAEVMGKVREAAAKADNPMALARPLVKDGTLSKWQASQLLYGYHQLVVGKYKLLDQLGAGEMGRVYLAEHSQMGRRHCLKVLTRRHTSKPEVLKRFLDEAQRVCALEHRNLSHIYDVNQDGDKYYIVMEFVEGQDLQKLVEKSGKLPPTQAADYARQMAEGLAHAHENTVVHGDLKPSNVVIDSGGTVKILDIGQARLAESPATSVEKDESVETSALAALIHHAPEQRGSVRKIDERSDVYSLGSVLCYLLTGKAAADSEDAAKQLQQVKQVPQALAQFCMKLMAAKPEDRPATMQDVQHELSTAVRETLLPPKPKSIGSKPAAGSSKDAAKSAEPAAKPKKPLVAKALTESGSLPVAKALEAPAAALAAADEEASPFTGFALQTKARPAGKKPPVKSSATGGLAFGVAPSASAARDTGQTSYLPLIIGGAIGGGVLAIAGIGLVVFLLFFRGGHPTEVAETPKDPAEAAAPDASSEGNPANGNSESNPAAEANPAAESNPAAAVEPATSTPESTKPVDPTAVATNTSGIEKPTPAPVKPADPPLPETKPADPPSPAPMPDPPQPAPKPAPPADPFVGFAKAVTLPKLGNAMTDLPPEALAAQVLGPCKVDEKALVIARLKGGEFAARGGRQKFEMVAANGGTALQDWDVNLVGGEAPIVVAKLSGKGGNLTFQWTPEGAKEPNAPFLANCALELSAGSGRHLVAFREPVVGPPLTVEVEKPGAAKWMVDNLPDPKSVYFEITKLEGIPRQKYDPENVMRGAGEDITIWTGPADDAMALGLNLKSAISGKNLLVTSAPQVKFEGMKKPEKYSKKKISDGKAAAAQGLNFLTVQLNALGKGNDERTEQQRSLINQKIEELNKGASQVEALSGFIEAIQGVGSIHFRVYYLAEDTQVDLLITSNEAAGPEKKSGEKK